MIEWAQIAAALAAVVVALLGVIWARVSGDLAHVAAKLAEVAQIVHGHEIRIDRIEGGK